MSAIPIGPPQYVETYPAVNRSVPLIRKNVGLVLKIWSMECLRDDALLLATELSANAIRHCGGGTFKMSLIRLDRGVRISMTDACTQLPSIKTVTVNDESGRGMWIIDAVASAWGVTDLLKGKQVWADLRIN